MSRQQGTVHGESPTKQVVAKAPHFCWAAGEAEQWQHTSIPCLPEESIRAQASPLRKPRAARAKYCLIVEPCRPPEYDAF